MEYGGVLSRVTLLEILEAADIYCPPFNTNFRLFFIYLVSVAKIFLCYKIS